MDEQEALVADRRPALIWARAVNWLKNIFGSKDEEPEVSIKPPFPPLTRDVFGDGSLFHWRGEVHLKSWGGFAAERDLTLDGWEPQNPRPDGCLSLCVNPLDMVTGTEPTSEQVNAFQHLLESEKAIRDVVLRGKLKVSPDWRTSYYGLFLPGFWRETCELQEF